MSLRGLAIVLKDQVLLDQRQLTVEKHVRVAEPIARIFGPAERLVSFQLLWICHQRIYDSVWLPKMSQVGMGILFINRFYGFVCVCVAGYRCRDCSPCNKRTDILATLRIWNCRISIFALLLFTAYEAMSLHDYFSFIGLSAPDSRNGCTSVH